MEERRHELVNITSAQPGRSKDLHTRQVRYGISMLVRTLCFLGAIAAHGPTRWVLVAAALFLPYVAVVMANNGRRRPLESDDVESPPASGELESKKADEE